MNMRPIQFGQSISATDKTYQWSHKALTFSDDLAKSLNKYADVQKKQPGLLSKVLGWSARQAAGFSKEWLSLDFESFHNIDVKLDKMLLTKPFAYLLKALKIPAQFSVKVAEPSKLALLIILFPFTVGPRLLRAYQRGKENNDFREIGDVLRRDITAITMFLFLLNPLIRGMNKIKQKIDGLNLVDGQENKIYTYSQFENLRISNANVLKALVLEGYDPSTGKGGNSRGLLNAIKGLHDHGLSKAGGSDAIQKLVDELKAETPDMVTALKNGQMADGDKWAESIVAKLKNAEELAQKAVDAASSEKVLKTAKKLVGSFTGVVTNYAKFARLPQDILGFAIAVGAIGWFPVWFNSQWNKKKFMEEQAAQHAVNLKNYDPALTQVALQQQSRLYNSFKNARF